ncbi:hypothetical protein GBAR_LOCUS18448, partial [Geodia barretti]
MTEVPEIYALRRNHDDIVGAMSHDLDYFKRMFVQAGFIRSPNASDIMGLLGVPASEKAGQLLESLLTQISESTPQETRQQKFHKFVQMLMREASTEDLGNRILHSYENPETAPVWKRHATRICGSHTLYWTIGVGIAAIAIGIYFTRISQENRQAERRCAKLHSENMNTCLELGENFGVKQEVLDTYRDSGKMPEEVCLELLDMWQKAGQVSSQDIESLSMAGILGIQKELAAKEMKADIR